jgi:hypothetical protein
MTLPPDLAKAAREMAEKYVKEKLGHAYEDAAQEYYVQIYTDAFRACYEHLCTMGPEFDEDAAREKAVSEFTKDGKVPAKYSWIGDSFAEGAKHQHSLMSTQLAARDVRIKELEAELEFRLNQKEGEYND